MDAGHLCQIYFDELKIESETKSQPFFQKICVSYSDQLYDLCHCNFLQQFTFHANYQGW